jgi:aminoglycoside phosphotransferase (APT) family kinase protein
MGDRSMQELLERYYRAHVAGGAGATVAHMQELRAGWESEIHFFEVTRHAPDGPFTEQRVLRIYPGEVAAAKAEAEYRALARLNALGYPVPRVFALATDDSPLGRPFMIMERVPGVPMWNMLFHTSAGDRQEYLLELFCRRFVELHRLDWRAFLDPDQILAYDDLRLPLRREIALLEGWSADRESSGFAPALAWLQARLAEVPEHRPGIVHLDYHPENVLLGPDDHAVVLDAVSDPRLDLGWTLVLVGAAEGWEWRDRILACYERLSGKGCDEIAYFEVCACVKRLGVVSLVMQGQGARLGLRSDLQAILLRQRDPLRRVYERYRALTGLPIPEMDCFLA